MFHIIRHNQKQVYGGKKKSTYRNKYQVKTQRDSVVYYIHFYVFLFCRAPGINTTLHAANNPLHYVGTNPNWQMKSNLRANDEIKPKGKSSHVSQSHILHVQIVKALWIKPV